DAIVGGFIKERTLAENIAFFEEAGVTAGPVYDIAQFLDDPHVQIRGIVVDAPDDEMGETPMHAPVPRLSRTPGVLRAPAPAVGQHNDEIYARIGHSGERRCDTRHGSMIVFGSITILRLWSGSEMNSRTFIVTSFFFEYFDTAMPRPGVMAGRWMILPSISAPGTRPKPALPAMTDSSL